MAIKAFINTQRTVVGSVSQGNQPQVTRVTVPGPKGDSGATGGKLVELADVVGLGVVIVTYLPSIEIFSTYVPRSAFKIESKS